MFNRLAIVLVLAAACGGGNKSGPDSPPHTEMGHGAHLVLGELKLVDVAKNRAVLIHADGMIEVDGEKLAKITADGKIVKPGTGEVGLALQADGSINGPDGKAIGGAKLAEDGQLTVEGKTVTIDAAGMLVGANPDAPQIRVEGAASPALKRTALFILLMMLLPEEPKGPTGGY